MRNRSTKEGLAKIGDQLSEFTSLAISTVICSYLVVVFVAITLLVYGAWLLKIRCRKWCALIGLHPEQQHVLKQFGSADCMCGGHKKQHWFTHSAVDLPIKQDSQTAHDYHQQCVAAGIAPWRIEATAHHEYKPPWWLPPLFE